MTPDTARLIPATVTAVNGDGSLTVTMLGQTGVRVRTLVTVAVSDTVLVLQAGKSFVVLGAPI